MFLRESKRIHTSHLNEFIQLPCVKAWKQLVNDAVIIDRNYDHTPQNECNTGTDRKHFNRNFRKFLLPREKRFRESHKSNGLRLLKIRSFYSLKWPGYIHGRLSILQAIFNSNSFEFANSLFTISFLTLKRMFLFGKQTFSEILNFFTITLHTGSLNWYRNHFYDWVE